MEAANGFRARRDIYWSDTLENRQENSMDFPGAASAEDRQVGRRLPRLACGTRNPSASVGEARRNVVHDAFRGAIGSGIGIAGGTDGDGDTDSDPDFRAPAKWLPGPLVSCCSPAFLTYLVEYQRH